MDATLKGIYSADAGVVLLAGGLTPGAVSIIRVTPPPHHQPVSPSPLSPPLLSPSSTPPPPPPPPLHPITTPSPIPPQTQGNCDVLVSLRLRPVGFNPSQSSGNMARRALTFYKPDTAAAAAGSNTQITAAKERIHKFQDEFFNRKLEDGPTVFDDLPTKLQNDKELNQQQLLSTTTSTTNNNNIEEGGGEGEHNGWLSQRTRERILPPFIISAILLLEKQRQKPTILSISRLSVVQVAAAAAADDDDDTSSKGEYDNKFSTFMPLVGAEVVGGEGGRGEGLALGRRLGEEVIDTSFSSLFESALKSAQATVDDDTNMKEFEGEGGGGGSAI